MRRPGNRSCQAVRADCGSTYTVTGVSEVRLTVQKLGVKKFSPAIWPRLRLVMNNSRAPTRWETLTLPRLMKNNSSLLSPWLTMVSSGL